MTAQVKFLNHDDSEFFNTLQTRVNSYFKTNGISKDGGLGLVAKSLLLISLFVAPYFFVIGFQPNVWLAAVLLILMGIGKAGVGMSIMHDALHGSFSKKKWINNLFGSSLYFLGGNPINWKIQHNVLHHTYPNVYKVDEDVSTKGFVLRLSPEADYKPIYKYQWLYILPLYSLMTLSFMVKDFRQLSRYNRIGATKRYGKSPTWEMVKLIVTKMVYLTIIIGLPILFTDYSIAMIIVGFLIVHFTAGLILSMVFQLAHVVEGVEYPERNISGDLDTSWAIHQLATTSNFAQGNRFVHWFTGGLNHQVEHHLFPHISHVHYPSISSIVMETAREYGIAYNSQPSVGRALISHLVRLRALGRSHQVELA